VTRRARKNEHLWTATVPFSVYVVSYNRNKVNLYGGSSTLALYPSFSVAKDTFCPETVKFELLTCQQLLDIVFF
jgi:hypothetical protein